LEWDNIEYVETRKYKMCFGYERYQSIIRNYKLRKYLTCFRLGSHNLEIEFGRFIGSQRHERICKMCNTKIIESEYHFLLTCPTYVDPRAKILGNCSWHNVQKFVNIMSCSSKCKLYKTAIYIIIWGFPVKEDVSWNRICFLHFVNDMFAYMFIL
jgi:hypothetical protein